MILKPLACLVLLFLSFFLSCIQAVPCDYEGVVSETNVYDVCVLSSVLGTQDQTTCSDASAYGVVCQDRSGCSVGVRSLSAYEATFDFDAARAKLDGTAYPASTACSSPVAFFEQRYKDAGAWTFDCTSDSSTRFYGTGGYGDPFEVRSLVGGEVLVFPNSGVPADQSLNPPISFDIWLHNMAPQRHVTLMSIGSVYFYLDMLADATLLLSRGDGQLSSFTQTLPLDQWVHILMVISPQETDPEATAVRLYLNGEGPYTQSMSGAFPDIQGRTSDIRFNLAAASAGPIGYSAIHVWPNNILTTQDARTLYVATAAKYKPTQVSTSWGDTICAGCGLNQRSLADGTGCTSSAATVYNLSTCADASIYPSGVCNQVNRCQLNVTTTSLVLNFDAARANGGIHAYANGLACGEGLIWQGVSVNALVANIGFGCNQGSPHWYLDPPRWESRGAYLDMGGSYVAVAPGRLLARSHEFWIKGDRSVLSLAASDYIVYTGDGATGITLSWTNINEFHIIQQFAGSPVADTTFAGSVWDDGWLHIVFTFSDWTGSEYNYNVYLNKALVASTAITVQYPVNNAAYGTSQNIALTWGELRSYNKELTLAEVVNNYDSTVHRYHPSLAVTCPGCSQRANERTSNDGATCGCDFGFYTNSTGSCIACGNRKGGNRQLICDPSTGLYPCFSGYAENIYGACILIGSGSSLSTCSDPSNYPSGSCDLTSQCTKAVATRSLVLNLDAARASPNGQAYSDALDCSLGLSWRDSSLSNLTSTITNTNCASHWYLNPPRWESKGEILQITSGFSAVAPLSGKARTYETWFRINRTEVGQGSYGFFFETGYGGIALYYPAGDLISFIQRANGVDAAFDLMFASAVDQWLHAAWVISDFDSTSSTHTITSYINGAVAPVFDNLIDAFLVEDAPYFRLSSYPITWGEYRFYARALTASEIQGNYAATVHRYHPSLALQCPGCSSPNQKSTNDGSACVCREGYTNRTAASICSFCATPGTYENSSSTCAPCKVLFRNGYISDCHPVTGEPIYPCSSGYTRTTDGVCLLPDVIGTNALSMCAQPSMYPNAVCDRVYQCNRTVVERGLVLHLDPARAAGNGYGWPNGTGCTDALTWKDVSPSNQTLVISSGCSFFGSGHRWYTYPSRWDSEMNANVFLSYSQFGAIAPLGASAVSSDFWLNVEPGVSFNTPIWTSNGQNIGVYYTCATEFCTTFYTYVLVNGFQEAMTVFSYSDAFSNNKWAHFTFTIGEWTGSSHRYVAYLNGVQYATLDVTRQFATSAYNDLVIGSGARAMRGEFRMYNRELSSAEAYNNYAFGAHRYQLNVDGVCQGCPTGTRSSADGTRCLCDAVIGSFNNTNGMCLTCPSGTSYTNTSQCIACPEGKYSLGALMQCTNCTAQVDPNSYCVATNGSYACIPPTLFQSSLGRCDCAPNYFGASCSACTGQTDPNTHCLDGFRSNGSYVCNAGMSFNPNTGFCDCAPGFYGSQCIQCGDQDQQIMYTHCVDGVNGDGSYVCDSPLVLTGGMCECAPDAIGVGRHCNQTCSDCPETTAECLPGSDTATCTCKANFYRLMGMNSSNCDCNAGVYGSTCSTNCSSSCFARQFGGCNDGYLGDGTCNCGAHRSLNVTSDVCECSSLGREGYHCTLCPSGTANNNHSQALCEACQPGTYASSPGQATCLTCPLGSIANATNATSCWPCPVGQYSINATTCVPCAPGSFAASEGTNQCTPCNAGSIAALPGASSCVACGEGTSASTSGLSQCTQCVSPTGTDPGATGTVTCLGCAIGKALGAAGICRNCSNGLFGNVTGLTQCLSCSAGRFSANDSLLHGSCLPCTAGSFSSVASSACLQCSGGTYSSWSGAAECLSCPSGRVAPSAGATACAACSPGRHKLTALVCTSCLAGTASAGGEDACSECQPGTFASGLENDQCDPCTDGFFVNTTAATECLACQSGYTTNAIVGRVNCTLAEQPVVEIPRLYSASPNRTSVANATSEIQRKERFEFTVTVAGDLASIVNLDSFMGQLAFEIALASNTTVDKVVITRVRAGSIIVDFNIPLTPAQVFQQLVATNTVYNATTYPILSASTQILVPDLVGLVDPDSLITSFRSNCTERVPFPGRTSLCQGFGACRRGMCVCDPVDSDSYCVNRSLSTGYTSASNVVCVQSGGNPDVCESQYTTGNRIDYLAADECRLRHPKYRNVFPLRRYCQNIDQTLGNDAFRAKAVFGRIPSMPCDGCDGMEPFLIYTLHFASVPVANTSSGFELQQFAYVSDLYDGLQPVLNKRWAWVESRYKYNNDTYQLSRLVFLPGVEGDPRWYYASNRWNFADCAAGEYAIGPDECVCQLNHVRHPLTGVCTQGCSNGKVGPECETATQDLLGCQFELNVFTAFLSYDCSRIVCKRSAHEVGGVCVPFISVSPDVRLLPVVISTSDSPLAVWQLVVACLSVSVASIALLFVVFRVFTRWRATGRKYKRVGSSPSEE